MFVKVWEVMLRVENVAESIRRKLINRDNFGLLQAFKSLDHDSDGHVSVQDVSYPFPLTNVVIKPDGRIWHH